MNTRAFWQTLALDEMSAAQWESLCDGCGRCCTIKIEDSETGRVHATRAACRLLDTEACRCLDYANRERRVEDCLMLDPGRARSCDWLPETCAYRRLAEGRGLSGWHPLVSGDPDTVHQAGISVRGQVISQLHVHESDLPGMIVDWGDAIHD